MPWIRKIRPEEAIGLDDQVLNELGRHDDGATAYELAEDLNVEYEQVWHILLTLEGQTVVWREHGGRAPRGWGRGRPQDVWRKR